jgi:tRNA threonylcarbamoyladenosine biosynthesis protein TsaB
MTTILALDSSSENCSVAVYHEQCMSLNSTHAPRKHTQLILPLLKQELSNRQLVLADVDAIAFGSGPGSFTGIRIAAGVAQGLAFGLGVPIYAISNLKALALQSYLDNGISLVLACIDARMGEVYWGLFEVAAEVVSDPRKLRPGGFIKRYQVNTIISEQVSLPEHVVLKEYASHNITLDTVAGIGSGIALLPEESVLCLKETDIDAQPNADTIAYLAEADIASGMVGLIKDALPSYVRDTVTWNKLPGRD